MLNSVIESIRRTSADARAMSGDIPEVVLDYKTRREEANQNIG